jgi:riboflavin biosynthesis pyrimidine reductase
MSTLLRLFPAPVETVPLEGLYLAQALRTRGDPARAFVYSNFIASLDGRIALKSSHTGSYIVPDAIANPRDWRLFQELAAQADVVITSGRYARQLAEGSAQDVLPVSEKSQYQDLLAWRQAQGLTPQPAVVIVSASLEVPITDAFLRGGRSVFVATGSKADAARVRALKQCGVSVLYAGTGRGVQGRSLIEALQQQGLRTVYSTAGPQVLATLLADRLLDRLYLTQVHRLLGGEGYATLIKGARLCPPADFELCALYYEAPAGDQVGQIFSIYAATEKTA